MATDEWYSNETFWREGYRFMFSDEAFAAARDHVDLIITLAGITAGRALDLCCGPGRHAVPLALRGFDVTGVDASPFLLGKAAEHASSTHAEIELVRADMREFCRPDTFDLAISMFSSFGYFGDEQAAVSEADGITRVERHEIVDEWTRINSEWILIGGNGVQRFQYSVRIYSGRELRDLLREAGFEDVRLYGDLAGRPYGPSASRLIALARKD